MIDFIIIRNLRFWLNLSYMIPIDPAVKPTARKKTNSSKSLGREFIKRLI